MAILDLHSVYDATGSTDTIVYENNSNAAIPAGDGATTIGLSPFSGALLCAYGAHVDAAAQALVALNLQSNNIVDPVNKLSDSVSATPTITSILKSKFLQTGYGLGSNLVGYANELAGKTATFKIDYLANVGTSAQGSFVPANVAEYSFAASAAATAGVYQTIAFNPSQTPPVGTYAILGTRTYGLTTSAVIRFQHTDFQGAFPGYPIVDYGTGSLTAANLGGNMWSEERIQGYQFVALSALLGKSMCPVFRIQGQSTGLNLQLLDTNADTVQFDLILQKVA